MPINGVPADVVRSRHDMGDQDGAYWIARDGQIFVFQPVKGIRDAATLASMVESHVEEIVRETVRWQVAELVERQLLGG
jgi:N-acetylglucosamine kinase-like BadF-type ATPase